MSSPVQPPLRVETVDGTTSGRPITTIKVTNGDLTISGSTATIDTSGGGGGAGTVTSVSSSQAFISIADPTTTPSITIGNASGAATGVLTASDFNTFDAKQDAITLTTTGTSGAATFSAGTLNIPQYSGTTGTVTSITAGDGLSGGTITGSGTIAIPAQGGISAGSYTSTDITVDARGIITAISNGSGGGGGIGGSITDNQVAVGATTADEIEGSSSLTFDASTGRLVVAERISSSGTNALTLETNNGVSSGKIEILNGGVPNHITITPASGRINAVASTLSVGTNAADTTISSRGAYNLTLNTNDGTNSGSIVIEDGVDGQISITPNGAGTIKLDGVELDNSAIATGYVLKATSATAAGWAAESGGAKPSIATSVDSAYDMYMLTSLPPFTRGVLTSSSQTIGTSPIFIPFLAPTNITGVAFEVNITGLALSTNLLMCLYESSTATGSPTTKVTNSEVTIDATSTGYKTAIFSSTIGLTNNTVYWIALCSNNNTITLRAHSSDQQMPVGLINGMDNFNKAIIQDTVASGSLPASSTDANLETSYIFAPLVGLQV